MGNILLAILVGIGFVFGACVMASLPTMVLLVILGAAIVGIFVFGLISRPLMVLCCLLVLADLGALYLAGAMAFRL